MAQRPKSGLLRATRLLELWGRLHQAELRSECLFSKQRRYVGQKRLLQRVEFDRAKKKSVEEEIVHDLEDRDGEQWYLECLGSS